MVKVKPVTYEPIADELNGSVALLQAASALDAAVYLAVESKNVEKLMDAVAMWIGLAERLGIELEDDASEESEPGKRRDFGFTSNMSKIDEPIKEVLTEDA
ncbi:hypothetical protein SEA_COMRADE_53 [Streptomyces phage Comrade]|uniref:Uncharacterized protein n=3 Tax=Gilsonvirus comrade TaxID=2846395 RepID=A0A345MDY7_9CAUD|nr:hypothetical protein HWB84_gp193 [Streptomyces phage Comrade]AXH68768.1 hypothetical protein SEA_SPARKLEGODDESS_53 [Streptomyces phage SparkleGoddess]QQO39739.1 hypothetical protein SEA_BELFORT_54 [Streptomyces phage Belfort]QZE11648.1 hypothetical protein SEA_KARP_51 [Streptomyces phage Karp]UTN92308.1 hypothetical protein SEA_STIGMA_52 [Streptomyces phage Stigma]AXQ63325.1 hypothetical protein SEA_COMRADE_53 [Streptomyces phage Comrade]